MNERTQEVYHALTELTDREQLEMIDAMLQRLDDANSADLTYAWRRVIQFRAADWNKGQLATTPWNAIKEMKRAAEAEAAIAAAR